MKLTTMIVHWIPKIKKKYVSLFFTTDVPKRERDREWGGGGGGGGGEKWRGRWRENGKKGKRWGEREVHL